MLKILFFSLYIFSAFNAEGKNDKPSELESLKSTKPHGQARLRSIFIGDIYDIYLWTDQPVWSFNAPFALSVNYLKTFTSKQLIDKTIEEMERLGNKNSQKYREKLKNLLPNVAAGDRITTLFNSDSSVTFFYNGTKKGTINDPKFSKYFSDIWLSPSTQEPKIRDKLLKSPS